MIDLILDDCMNVMKKYKDNHFDLAIVDPPYGINIAKNGSLGCDKFTKKNWDAERPSIKYFDELFRVSKNQVIWGYNYFSDMLPPCKGFIYWNKLNHHSNRADGELAYTSFDNLAKHFEYMWDGNRYGFPNNIKGVGQKSIRIHPTQKPIKLYEWLLHNYCEKGQKILDTHLGSGSIAVACHYFGVDLVGVEIDKEYYNKAKKRIEMLTAQETLF